jgi:hypothetical protein
MPVVHPYTEKTEGGRLLHTEVGWYNRNMSLEQLKDKHLKDSDIERAERALKESSSDDRVLFHLKDLDNMSNVVMKFELLRWAILPIVGVIAYYLFLHVFKDGFLHDAMGYVMGLCVLGFGFLSYIIDTNKVSNAEHKELIAAMFAVRDRIKKK